MAKQSIRKLSRINRSKRHQPKRKLSWSELTPGKKAGVVALGTAQLALHATAWRDLAKRPATEINGKKGIWAAIIAVNWVGPIAYFVRGRRAVA